MIHLIAQSTGHSVRRICDSLPVSRSSCYYAAAPTQSQRSDAQMSLAIGTLFHQHRRRYGYRRIWKQLAIEGFTYAPDRVHRLMQERGLIAIQPKTYVPQTSDGRANLPSPNLLLDQPLPSQRNEVWAGDISFIPCGEKIALPRRRHRPVLATHCFASLTPSGRLLWLAVSVSSAAGWALADHLRSELAVEALKQAIASTCHTTGLIYHSYRGSRASRNLLRLARMR